MTFLIILTPYSYLLQCPPTTSASIATYRQNATSPTTETLGKGSPRRKDASIGRAKLDGCRLMSGPHGPHALDRIAYEACERNIDKSQAAYWLPRQLDNSFLVHPSYLSTVMTSLIPCGLDYNARARN